MIINQAHSKSFQDCQVTCIKWVTHILTTSPTLDHTSPTKNEDHVGNLCLFWKTFFIWTYVGRGRPTASMGI